MVLNRCGCLAMDKKVFSLRSSGKDYSSFCHGWVNHMESSTRFSIYRQFKHCFEREYYVAVIWINIYRNAPAQFRMGVSQINTHKYRYSKLSEEVNCPFYENTPESEIHFLLHCPAYRNLRTRYLVKYNRNISDQKSGLLVT